MNINNKRGKFAPFWVILGILGIFLLGSFITPFRIVLDDSFERWENNAIAEGDTNLSPSNPDAHWWVKSTAFVLGGFMAVFVLYGLYNWISGMVNGARSSEPVFSKKYRALQQALNE